MCLFVVERRAQTDLVQNRYLGSSHKYLEPFFSFPSSPIIKGSSHKKKNSDFLKNGINNFDQILLVYTTFDTQQHDSIDFFGKIHETRKLFFNLLSIEYTLANLVQIRYILQISPARFSVFDKPLKLRVVHIGKKLKISIFSKMAPTILIKFCGFIAYLKPSSMTLSAFSEKSLKLENQFLIFCLSRNVESKPTDQSCSNSISGVPLQIFPVSFFFFFSCLFVFDLPSK